MIVSRRLAAALCLAVLHPLAAQATQGPVAATIERVIDGDTLKVRAEIWIDQSLSVSVRVKGADAPELFRPRCAAEKDVARAAKAFVERRLAGGAVTLVAIEHDKYGGRVAARVLAADGADLADALIEAGLAVADGEDDPWCR